MRNAIMHHRAAASRSAEPLLGEPFARTSLGLLAARTAQAAERQVQGLDLDEAERSTLAEAMALLGLVKGALDYVTTDGDTGSASAVSFTEFSSMVATAERTDVKNDVGEYIDLLIDAVENTLKGDSSDAEEVTRFFSHLADFATSEAGSAGDITL